MGEPLNETGLDGKGLIIRGKHLALLDKASNCTTAQRLMGEAVMLRPYLVFVRDKESYEDWAKKYRTSVSVSVCVCTQGA